MYVPWGLRLSLVAPPTDHVVGAVPGTQNLGRKVGAPGGCAADYCTQTSARDGCVRAFSFPASQIRATHGQTPPCRYDLNRIPASGDVACDC